MIHQRTKEESTKKQCQDYGGLAVIAGFLVSVIYLVIVMSIENTINLGGKEQYGIKLLGFLGGIIILAITCLILFKKNVNGLVKANEILIPILIVIVILIRNFKYTKYRFKAIF